MSFDKSKVAEQQGNRDCYIIGWCDTYGNKHKVVAFSNARKKALIDCIRKRRYNFNFSDYQYLPYCCPVYKDKSISILSKEQFDDVMGEAYSTIPRGKRLIPMDVITRLPKDGVLYEKEKYENEV